MIYKAPKSQKESGRIKVLKLLSCSWDTAADSGESAELTSKLT